MKNNKLILMSISVAAILLVAIAGLTYAWFSATVDTIGGNSVIVKAANLGTITFYNGSEINQTSVYPGWCETKRVSVNASNDATVNNTYHVYLNVVNNTVSQLGDTLGHITMTVSPVASLTIVTSGNTAVASTRNITQTSGQLEIASGVIAPSDIHTYDVTFCFPELSKNQNSQQGKVFNAYLNITTDTQTGEVSSCPAAVAFATDSWETIACNVQNGTDSVYQVGDTKSVAVTGIGNKVVRISNKTTTANCSNNSFSETACGFVVEFEDNVLDLPFDSEDDAAGWHDSSLRTYLNTTFYSTLPSDLQDVIVPTRVISGTETNTLETTQDNLYIASLVEVYGTDCDGYDNLSASNTKILDYYNVDDPDAGTCWDSNPLLSKNGYGWWTRSKSGTISRINVFTGADGMSTYGGSNSVGVSPLFRIG